MLQQLKYNRIAPFVKMQYSIATNAQARKFALPLQKQYTNFAEEIVNQNQEKIDITTAYNWSDVRYKLQNIDEKQSKIKEYIEKNIADQNQNENRSKIRGFFYFITGLLIIHYRGMIGRQYDELARQRDEIAKLRKSDTTW